MPTRRPLATGFLLFSTPCGNPPDEGCPLPCGKQTVCRLLPAFDCADDGRASDDRDETLLHRDLLRLGD